MASLLFRSILVSPVVLGAALIASGSAGAVEAKVAGEATQSQASALQLQAPVAAPEASKVSNAPVFSDKVTAEAPVAPVQIAQTVSPAEATPTTDVNTLEQVNRYSREGRNRNSMGQVTSVSQLTDVRPTDWAFQALQSLVERYGCIVGYPDRTYRGNRALSRYEFAAGLNACLDRINELIAASTADLVKKEDLEALRKLQEEFAAELATLRGRVDALEARTATLERQQFSTTTKLAGEAIFAISDEFGQPFENETVFQNRVRLVLNTSFSGKDLLVTRLSAGNAASGTASIFQQPGAEGQQTYNVAPNNTNSVVVDWLAYYFPLGNNGQVYIPAFGGLHYDYAPTQGGLMENFDGGTGPLSIFAQRNPIYNIGGGAGIGTTFGFNAFKVSLGYLADNGNTGANIPTQDNGLFSGNYSALAQVTFGPSESFSVGLTYVNAYRKNSLFDLGGTTPVVGSGLDDNLALGTSGLRVNAFGVSAALKISNAFSINAFGTYADVDAIGDGFDAAEIWSFGAGIAFSDFGRKGNLLGIAAGVQPYIGNAREIGRLGVTTNDMPLHAEAFYKVQLNDNISITPGVIWIFNPGQNDANDDVIIGTVRTTFTF